MEINVSQKIIKEPSYENMTQTIASSIDLCVHELVLLQWPRLGLNQIDGGG